MVDHSATSARSRNVNVIMVSLGSGGAELRAGPLQVLRHVDEQRLAVGDRVVELLERDVEGGQGAVLDGAMIEAEPAGAQGWFRPVLHPVEFFDRIATPRRRDHV